MIERIPPHNLEAEQAILGSMLVDREAIARVANIVDASAFYSAGNGAIFAAMVKLSQADEPVDLLTVRDALGARLDTVGGYGYLLDLGTSTPTTAHVDHYAEIVAEKARRRDAIKACAESLDALFDPDSGGDPAADALGRLMAVQAHRAEKTIHVGEVAEKVVNEAVRAVEARKRYQKSLAAITTGLSDLDRMLYIGPSDYVVLAARPSAGKTALALQLITKAAEHGPVYFASLEMNREAITRRLIAQRTGVSTYKQRMGFLTPEEQERIATAAYEIEQLPIYIDDRPGLSMAQILSAAQVLQARVGLALVVADHLSLVKPASSRASEYEAMTQVSLDFKNMTRRLNVPGLAIAQFNRATEKENRRPRMSDLRGAGGVEQDADGILALHRPEREQSFAEAEIIVLKQRDGECGTVKLFFEAERTLFRGAVKLGALA